MHKRTHLHPGQCFIWSLTHSCFCFPVVLQLRHDLAGTVVGRGGGNIQSLQQATGATVQIARVSHLHAQLCLSKVACFRPTSLGTLSLWFSICVVCYSAVFGVDVPPLIARSSRILYFSFRLFLFSFGLAILLSFSPTCLGLWSNNVLLSLFSTSLASFR